MRLVECEVIEDCLGIKRVGQSANKKPFRRGMRVVGTVTNVAMTPDSQVLAIKTKDGYIIPEPFLNVIGEVNTGRKKRKTPSFSSVEDVEEFEIVDENKSENKSVSDIYKSLKSADIISSNSLKSKRVVNFALVGAGAGLVYALLRGKGKLLSATIGGIVGGIAGNYVSKKIVDNGDE